MKILHVISQRPEFTGSGITIRALIREAASKGHINFLVAGIPEGGRPHIDELPSQNAKYVEFEGPDLPFPVVGMSNTMPYRSYRFMDLSPEEITAYQSAFSKKLQESVSIHKPDVIHCHHLWVVTACARRLFPDIPIVASCHGTALRQLELSPHLRSLVVPPCGELDQVLALGQVQAEEISKLYGIQPGKIRIVGGGYNQRLFGPMEKKDQKTIDILYAGKLSDSKGVPWLLRSLSQLDIPNWRLHLAGSGSEASRQTCEQLASKLNAEVIFHGMLSQEELARQMRQSHIFVLPSFYEGLPLVVLEALASGCRIIATSLPGTREIFRDPDTDYVNLIDLPLEAIDRPFKQDEPSLENQLAMVLEKEIRKASEQPNLDLSTVNNLLSKYTWKEVFQRIESVYYDVGNTFQ